MSKIKLTKGELKKQRDSLKQFKRYLPTLQLKKQQLQSKILEIRQELASIQASLNEYLKDVEKWCGVLGEDDVDVTEWVTPLSIETDFVNIAGANVPVFNDINFKAADYDYYATPFWIDRGIEEIRKLISFNVKVEIVKEQIKILEKELRTTTQRVNLFEKIKIPECLNNIRVIRIYLGDQMANAVGISKVAKKKVDARNADMALA